MRNRLVVGEEIWQLVSLGLLFCHTFLDFIEEDAFRVEIVDLVDLPQIVDNACVLPQVGVEPRVVLVLPLSSCFIRVFDLALQVLNTVHHTMVRLQPLSLVI